MTNLDQKLMNFAIGASKEFDFWFRMKVPAATIFEIIKKSGNVNMFVAEVNAYPTYEKEPAGIDPLPLHLAFDTVAIAAVGTQWPKSETGATEFFMNFQKWADAL